MRGIRRLTNLGRFKIPKRSLGGIKVRVSFNYSLYSGFLMRLPTQPKRSLLTWASGLKVYLNKFLRTQIYTPLLVNLI